VCVRAAKPQDPGPSPAQQDIIHVEGEGAQAEPGCPTMGRHSHPSTHPSLHTQAQPVLSALTPEPHLNLIEPASDEPHTSDPPSAHRLPCGSPCMACSPTPRPISPGPASPGPPYTANAPAPATPWSLCAGVTEPCHSGGRTSPRDVRMPSAQHQRGDQCLPTHTNTPDRASHKPAATSASSSAVMAASGPPPALARPVHPPPSEMRHHCCSPQRPHPAPTTVINNTQTQRHAHSGAVEGRRNARHRGWRQLDDG
jgi:hypothetical protein